MQPAADRPPPADDPPAAGQRRARQGHRRVRRAHSRRAEQPAVRVRGVRGAPPARRPRARAQARDGARGARRRATRRCSSRVADFYARIGENERSLKVLQRLAQRSSGDPGHLVDLGDRYFQDGNTALAVQTWKRILAVVQPRAKALAALGDVYLEHDMIDRRARRLQGGGRSSSRRTSATRRRSPSAYERTQQLPRGARALRGDRREGEGEGRQGSRARVPHAHRRRCGGSSAMLEQQVPALETAVSRATRRTSRRDACSPRRSSTCAGCRDAEATLRRVIELAPGDADSYLALERVLVQENKIADAIAVLEKLAAGRAEARARALPAHGPVRAPDLQGRRRHQVRGARGRAQSRRRRGAPAARRDVPLASRTPSTPSPSFARPSRRTTGSSSCTSSSRTCCSSKGQTDEADRLFRRVVRGAPDEELVARAARLSMQINLGKGTLESLEQDLLPLAIGNPQKPIYRRLLVEIYGSLTFGLVQRVRHGSAAGRGRGARRAGPRRGARGEAAARRARRRGREPAAHRHRRAGVRAEQERGASRSSRSRPGRPTPRCACAR